MSGQFLATGAGTIASLAVTQTANYGGDIGFAAKSGKVTLLIAQ